MKGSGTVQLVRLALREEDLGSPSEFNVSLVSSGAVILGSRSGVSGPRGTSGRTGRRTSRGPVRRSRYTGGRRSGTVRRSGGTRRRRRGSGLRLVRFGT